MDAAEDAAYHRLAHARGKRVLVEPLVIVVVFLVALAALYAVIKFIAGVKRIEDLDGPMALVALLGGLALLIPIAKLAAQAGGRASGQLSSVVGRLRWRWLFECVGLALITNVVALGGRVLLYELLGLEDGADTSAWVGWAAFLPSAAAILLLAPLQAAGEEFVMRGTLVQVVGAWAKRPWLPIVLSAAVFAVIHLTALEGSVFIFLMGAITAWLTIRTGGLEAGIAEHAVNNTILLLLVAAIQPEQFAQDDLNAGAEVGPMVSQTAGLLLYAALVLRRSARRNARAHGDRCEDSVKP